MSENDSSITPLRNSILIALDHATMCFIWEHRKKSPTLPIGVIEQAIKDVVITIKDLLDRFEETLKRALL